MSYKYIKYPLLALAFSITAPDVRGIPVPDEVKAIPVQYQGRVMPFESFAREQILSVTSKLKLKGASPSGTLLSWMADPESASSARLFEVGYDPLRKEVGLDAKRRKYNLDELLGTPKIMQLGSESARIKQQEGKPTRVQSEAEKLLGKMGSHYALLTAQVPSLFPTGGSPEAEWLGLEKAAMKNDSISAGIHLGLMGLLQGYKSGDVEGMRGIAVEMKRLIVGEWLPDPKTLKRFEAEVLYNKYRPVQWGRTFYLVGLLSLLGGLIGWSARLTQSAGFFVTLGFASQVVGLLMRAYIGGRAPWSNFYESLTTIVAVVVLLGLLFAKGRLKPLILGGTAFVGYAALLIADNAGLTAGVDTLVPALQSYWLTIHVIVILAGYAAATLAMVLGHVTLGVEAFKPNDKELFLASSKSVYRAVQMAMLLLFAGTILGGVWAHEAWGRYWGWDPKETWALISWFGYLGVAHARFAGWLNPRGVALASIGVYPLILMTYYGVNYLLSGLHSYAGGESAAIPPLLIGFVLFEAFVVLAGAKGWHTMLGRRDTSKAKETY